MDENQNDNQSEEEKNSANMYSYNDGVENNNQSQKEPDAIRRSLGSMNPYRLEENNNNDEYDPKGGDKNPNTADHPNYEEKSSEERIPNTKESYSPFSVPPFIQQEPPHAYRPASREEKKLYFVFPFFILILQLIFIIVFKFIYEYTDDGKLENDYEKENPEFSYKYHFFKDVHLMIFIGFGLLYTALKDHQWSSVGISLFIGVISFEMSFFWNYLWENSFKKKEKTEWLDKRLNFDNLIQIDYITATVLISLGAIIGKFSLIQYSIIAFFEVIFASLNYFLCLVELGAIDNGGSLYIHTFGATFGLMISMICFFSKKEHLKISSSPHLSSNYYSNIISFIGCLFLWLYFPSFNVAHIQNCDIKERPDNNNQDVNNGQPNDQQVKNCENVLEIFRYRGIVNTYLSMIGSAIATFVISPLISKGKLKIEHILNASYVGGIIIGGCCTICSSAWGAILIGTIGGALSTLLLGTLKKILKEKKFEDTFGILCTFLIPGFLGGFLDSIFMGNFTNPNWENHPLNDYFSVPDSWNEKNQAGIQVAAIFITIGIAAISGLCVGFIVKTMNCDKNEIYFVDSEYYYEDEKIDFPEWKYPRVNPP